MTAEQFQRQKLIDPFANDPGHQPFDPTLQQWQSTQHLANLSVITAGLLAGHYNSGNQSTKPEDVAAQAINIYRTLMTAARSYTGQQ